VYEWDTQRGVVDPLARLTGKTREAVYSPDGSLLAVAGGDGAVHLIDTDGAREIARMRHERGEIHSVAFSPDGRLVLAQDSIGVARLWPSDIRAAARAALAPIRAQR
jgi:WD40 repeat protein